MKIFDAHMHFSDVQGFYYAAEQSGVDYSYEGYLKEREAAGIVGSVCMGIEETKSYAFPDKETPLPMTANLSQSPPPSLYTCLGINPHRLNADYMQAAEEKIKNDKTIVGFKIYGGYYHFYMHDQIYWPVYEMAEKYGLTVAIHTGDTYSEEGLLEYSHPLAADRVAVRFRDVNFLLCHMGDPWIMDACEVAYKNRNVYVDISGLLAGNAEHIAATEGRDLVMQHYKLGITYLNNYKKVLFGTDWPLVPMGAYIDFCKKLMPQSAYEDVFFNNAIELYNPL